MNHICIQILKGVVNSDQMESYEGGEKQ